MTQSDFDIHISHLHDMAEAIIQAKRPDYTKENVDILANFKETAAAAGITPLQVWAVHFYKQFSAIARHAKSPNAATSEPISSRFADLLNYIELGYGLYAEEQNIPL